MRRNVIINISYKEPTTVLSGTSTTILYLNIILLHLPGVRTNVKRLKTDWLVFISSVMSSLN